MEIYFVKNFLGIKKIYDKTDFYSVLKVYDAHIFVCIRTIQENKRKFVIYDTHHFYGEQKENLRIGIITFPDKIFILFPSHQTADRTHKVD